MKIKSQTISDKVDSQKGNSPDIYIKFQIKFINK